MIPFIRSINELMVITQSRDQRTKSSVNMNFYNIKKNSGQRKLYLRSRIKKNINSPKIAKINRKKWIKNTNIVKNLINNLNFNNKIESILDHTLLNLN